MSTARNSGVGMTSRRTRQRMVERLRALGIRDETVLAAMNDIPRHIFVDEALASRAYEDIALPLGFGQTISSPYTVARMTVRAAVLGAGSFGSCLAILCADRGHDVTLWARDEALVGAIAMERRNPRFLKDIEFPAAIA